MTPSGILVPIVTPFRDGEIDHASADRLVEHLIGQGVTGLVLLGTTAESLALTEGESRSLTERLVDRIAARVPVYVGVSGAATSKVVHALAGFEDLPIDGYLVSCPYYNRPPQDGLLAHFTAVAEATTKQIIVYNIPSRTAINMSNEILLDLAQRPNIVGVKDCCGSLEQSFELLSHRPPEFRVLTGEDHLLPTMLTHGGDGGILASAHVGTGHFTAVVDAFAKNDVQSAARAWAKLAPVVTLLFREPNPMPIKYWLWRQGILTTPQCRLPLTSISKALQTEIDTHLATLD